jgi:catechol 2,3-dioxygenase-like lactoylglutathione lyase family enzyme
MRKLLRTHHVAVICSDSERSRRFYINILGLEVVREVHRRERDSYKPDLRLPDGTQIELFSLPDPPKRPSNPEACGLRHLAFKVADVDEAARWRRDPRSDRTERAVGPWLAPLRRRCRRHGPTEPAAEQLAQGGDGLPGIGAVGDEIERRAAPGGEDHEVEEALGVGRGALAQDRMSDRNDLPGSPPWRRGAGGGRRDR